MLIIWVWNKDNTWKNSKEKIELHDINETSFSIQDIENGDYDVEFWDTYKGIILSTSIITAKNKTLRINLPTFSKDIALKVKRKK